MKSSPFLLTLLSCVATEATTANSHHPRSTLARRRPSSTSWATIPRGGSDDNSSSSSSTPDISSLLSSMMPGGMPDLSAPPSPEQIQQSMEQFTSLLSSPQFKDIMNDPSKLADSLETMRTALLGALEEMEKGDNPMMKMMMEQMKSQLAGAYPGGWDGLKQLIEDPAQWQEMMGGLVDVLKSLGEDDINNIMSQMAGAAGMGGGMGGMPGMGGMGGMGGMPGMGGNTLGDAFGGDTAGTLAGLDDLSEGED
mmetsp:Transcript_30187/g.63966  ORF Transcript_30187/g.63966 Transcript_30187/m.63966 type:complete len:252 (-) Transcript_30187:287-1042(-)